MNAPADPRSFLPRIPDWVFAAALTGSIVLLLFAIGWSPDADQFTEPGSETETSTGSSLGSSVPLEEARPDEEPPPVEAIAVEEFGYAASEDGYSVIWGASLANTHKEYGARFELRVTLTGSDFSKQESYSSIISGETPPGGRVVAGGELFGGEIPSDVEAEMEVVGLSWFAFEDGEAPGPQVPPVSARIDAVEEGSDGKSRLFAVTLANDSLYMYRPYLQAVFRAADGALLGASAVGSLDSLPSGESSRTIEVWAENIPVGADLSLTELVPAW